MNRSQWSRLALAWASTVLLLALCLWPRSWMPAKEDTPSVPTHTDKLIHFGLFAQCAACWTIAVPRGRRGRVWRGVVIAAGFALAVGTEAAQGSPFIDRDPDRYDALADVVGWLAGALVLLPFVRNGTEPPGG